MGPRAGLDAVEKRKMLLLLGIEPIPTPIARRYTDSAIPTPTSEVFKQKINKNRSLKK
jgi:hypothetical protein